MMGKDKAKTQFVWAAVLLVLFGVFFSSCLPREARQEIGLDDQANDAELRERARPVRRPPGRDHLQGKNVS